MSGPAEPQLPTTSFAVLGLLASAGESSGYDLKRLADDSLRFFFKIAQSQVYNELRRLADGGFVTAREVRQEGRPDKRVFAITDAGREALEAWIDEGEAHPVTIVHPVILRMFFGQFADPARLRRMLERYAELNDGVVSDLEAIRARLDEFGDPTFPGMMAEWGVAIYGNEGRAIATALTRLDELAPPEPED